MPAKKYYNIAKSVLAVVFLLIGAYGGWFVFTKVLGKPYPEEGFRPVVNDDKPKKDTVYVKVVDPVFSPSAGSIANEPPKKEEPNNQKAAVEGFSDAALRKNNTDGKKDKTLPPQTGARLQAHVPQDISPDVYGASLRTGDMENKDAFKKVFSGWHIWMALGVSLLIMLVAFFTKDDAIANATLKDIPPPVLETLFKKLQYEINLFRNPRKILRYRNAVSYHYFFFKQKKLDSPDNVEKMMWLLLAIHRLPDLVDTRNVSDAALTEPDWFLQNLAKSPYADLTKISLPEDKEMVMMVLKLNADMG
jgi:hypothetical protein